MPTRRCIRAKPSEWCSWTPSFRAWVTGRVCGCSGIFGTSISMAKRRWRWSGVESESIWSTSGTTSPPIQRHSIPERDRRLYTATYARPRHVWAGMEWFRAFEQDGKELAELAKTPLTMPMLVLSGEKAGGEFLIEQGRLVDNNVEGVVVKGSGHWLMEEAPDQVIPALVAFLNK